MADILVVAGSRPEAIKLGPVVAELRALGAPVKVVLTGQHVELLRGTPADHDLQPAENLHLKSDGNVAKWLTRAQASLKNHFLKVAPSVVVVQGDTMTVEAASAAAQALDIPIAHAEAGVRSGDMHNPWPEERTRVIVAQRATWHYAPTSTAFANLLAEGIDQRSIRVTGNTCVSALARYAPNVVPTSNPEPIVLVTLHRREVQHNVTAEAMYAAVRLAALKHTRLHFVWPMHPGFAKLIGRFREPWNLKIVEPLAYVDCVRMLAGATGVITDSGGLCEEAATLGVPTAIIRAVNDRPEAEHAGIARRFPVEHMGIMDAVDWVQTAQRVPSACFGAADAAAQIARHLSTLGA